MAASGEEKAPTPAADRGRMQESGLLWTLEPPVVICGPQLAWPSPGAALGFPQTTHEVSKGGPSADRAVLGLFKWVKRPRGDPTESCKVPKRCDSSQ